MAPCTQTSKSIESTLATPENYWNDMIGLPGTSPIVARTALGTDSLIPIEHRISCVFGAASKTPFMNATGSLPIYDFCPHPIYLTPAVSGFFSRAKGTARWCYFSLAESAKVSSIRTFF